MKIEMRNRGAFSSTLVKLAPGESFVSESGALFRSSGNINVDVSTRAGGGAGGLLGGLKRLVAGEKFFFSTYTVGDDQEGEVGLAPTLQGEMRVLPCDGSTTWVLTGGSYLGSTPELTINTKFQGFKGLFSGESLSFVEVTGKGHLLVSAFGRITEIDVEGGLVVDTGHVVAFESTLSYSISKAGGSWFQSWLVGEGLVLNFEGKGKIYVQSHNPSEFGGLLGPKLPQRS